MTNSTDANFAAYEAALRGVGHNLEFNTLCIEPWKEGPADSYWDTEIDCDKCGTVLAREHWLNHPNIWRKPLGEPTPANALEWLELILHSDWLIRLERTFNNRVYMKINTWEGNRPVLDKTFASYYEAIIAAVEAGERRFRDA